MVAWEDRRVTDLAFVRASDDRRAYDLEGVGRLRLGSWWRRDATITGADGREWQARRVGWGRRAVATDGAGTEVAAFEPKGGLARGGRLGTAAGRSYELRPSSVWKERYALVDGGTEVAAIEASGWGGRRPVRVSLPEGRAPDAMVLLLAGWLVKTFADDAGATAGASAATTSAAVS
jgi:hypothetical protein